MAATPPASVLARAAAGRLRAFWAAGQAADRQLAAPPGPAGRSARAEAVQDAAAAAGINPDTMSKAIRAAREYTKAQIAELCRLVVEHEATFSASHLARLLAVADRTARDEMARQAIAEKWGLARLGRVIQVARGPRGSRATGRPPHVPDEQPREVLARLAALAWRFERFATAGRASLPGPVLAAVDRAITAAAAVRERAEGELASPSRPGRRPRPRGQ